MMKAIVYSQEVWLFFKLVLYTYLLFSAISQHHSQQYIVRFYFLFFCQTWSTTHDVDIYLW